MSGGGNSGGGPAYSPSEVGETPCSQLKTRTLLNSPKSTAVAKLSVGSILDVTVDENDVLVAVHDDHVVGSIVTHISVRIIECIKGGAVYEAEVEEVSQGKVVVVVRHAPE